MTAQIIPLPKNTHLSVASPLAKTINRVQTKDQSRRSKPKPEAIANGHVVSKVTLPDGFSVKKDGYYFCKSSEKAKPFKVCGYFELTAHTRSVSNDNWGSVIEFHDPDGYRHRCALAKALLAADGAEMRSIFLNLGLHIEGSSEARGKFNELIAGLKTDRRALAVDRIGWAGNVFVLPGSTIGDVSSQLVIYQGAEGIDHPYRTAGTLDDWQECVAKYAIGNSRVILALAAAFVGPCLTLLGEEGGGFHFRGPSSTGKSTTLSAGGSVWGPERIVLPWRATLNGLEGSCVQHNETLLLLDEVAAIDPKDAGTAAYMIANGRGKARANRAGLLRSSASWTVMFLSSGEISLAEQAGRDARGAKRSAAGQDVRICDVPADAGAGLGIFNTVHNAGSGDALARLIKAGCRTAYGTAGPAFVAAIIPIKDTVVSKLKAAIESFVTANVPKKADGQVARVARRFALVAAVGELAVNLGILPWPATEATEACSVVFRD